MLRALGYRPLEAGDRALFSLREPDAPISYRGFLSAYAYSGGDTMWLRDDGRYMSLIWLDEDGMPYAFPPMGEYEAASYRAAVEGVASVLRAMGAPVRLSYVSEPELSRFPGCRAETDEGEDDYVYECDALITLASSHHNRHRHARDEFERSHEVAFRAVAEADEADCARVIDGWCEGRDCALCVYGCLRERALRCVKNASAIGLMGCLMTMDGEPEGLALCGALSRDTLDLGFVFARHTLRGECYSLLAGACRSSDAKYLNFEEDMGLCGLRQYKRSLLPVRMARKFTVWLD